MNAREKRGLMESPAWSVPAPDHTARRPAERLPWRCRRKHIRPAAREARRAWARAPCTGPSSQTHVPRCLAWWRAPGARTVRAARPPCPMEGPLIDEGPHVACPANTTVRLPVASATEVFVSGATSSHKALVRHFALRRLPELSDTRTAEQTSQNTSKPQHCYSAPHTNI